MAAVRGWLAVAQLPPAVDTEKERLTYSFLARCHAISSITSPSGPLPRRLLLSRLSASPAPSCPRASGLRSIQLGAVGFRAGNLRPKLSPPMLHRMETGSTESTDPSPCHSARL